MEIVIARGASSATGSEITRGSAGNKRPLKSIALNGASNCKSTLTTAGDDGPSRENRSTDPLAVQIIRIFAHRTAC